MVHHKGRKKTTDTESGTAVGSVSLVAMQEKMAKKKPKEVDMNFYRFQKREAHLSGTSSFLNRTILIFNYSVVTTHDGTKIMLICSRHSMKLFAIPVWVPFSLEVSVLVLGNIRSLPFFIFSLVRIKIHFVL